MIWVAILPVARAGFVEATPNVLSLGGSKTTGAAVFDFDQDGDWDLVAPEEGGERLIRSDGAGGWDDVTRDLAPDLLSSDSTRGLLAGDLNNDGYPDLVRVERYRASILQNQGPPDFGFIEAWDLRAKGNNFGFEGSALLDTDNDGWLDVLLAEASQANWIAVNPGDGTMEFMAIDQSAIGMETSFNSDFATVGDWDRDGDVDVVLRGAGQGPDAFTHGANGWIAVRDFDLNADDEHKGSVTLCDVQATGVLDLFWTSNVEPAVLVFRWDSGRDTWSSAWNG